VPQRIAWFIEDQSFSQSVGKFNRRHTERLKRVTQVADGGGDGRGSKSYDDERAWSSLKHSILSALAQSLLAPPLFLKLRSLSEADLHAIYKIKAMQDSASH
jgi:hypothetical protein